MRTIDRIYIAGQFVTPHGTQTLQLIDPVTERPSTTVVLADVEDARAAIAAAKAAYASFRTSSLDTRAHYLDRLREAVLAREGDLIEAMIEEYGGPRTFSTAIVASVAAAFARAKQAMREVTWERQMGRARVTLQPLGVVGIITPWNASNYYIASKLAMALAAGSTAVIKPSELSARQTQILAECVHAAALPPGLVNIVTGRGDVVGAELVANHDVAKISFTGSTVVGKSIARGAADTLKRVTLELGGKSPNVLLDDADFSTTIPLALSLAYMNSGQACVAGTRLLVPRTRLEEAKRALVDAVANVRVGDPTLGTTNIGPMVSSAQYARVQSYIELGVSEGATLLAGGPGRPAGLDTGYFTRPTIFVDVTNDMRIAREEIFGPVLAVIAYDNDDDAIAIANDTEYGLQAYVSGGPDRAARIASQIVAGRVFVNGIYDEPLAPFGGFKQSGLGREYGTFGLEAYLEPKAEVLR